MNLEINPVPHWNYVPPGTHIEDKMHGFDYIQEKIRNQTLKTKPVDETKEKRLRENEARRAEFDGSIQKALFWPFTGYVSGYVVAATLALFIIPYLAPEANIGESLAVGYFGGAVSTYAEINKVD